MRRRRSGDVGWAAVHNVQAIERCRRLHRRLTRTVAAATAAAADADATEIVELAEN